MNEDTTDEVIDRLGGPSKISKLAERVERLEVLLAEKTAEIEAVALRATVRVGQDVDPTGKPLSWYTTAGLSTYIYGPHRIEGIAHDWVVVRNVSTNELFWASENEITKSLVDHV